MIFISSQIKVNSMRKYLPKELNFTDSSQASKIFFLFFSEFFLTA